MHWSALVRVRARVRGVGLGLGSGLGSGSGSGLGLGIGLGLALGLGLAHPGPLQVSHAESHGMPGRCREIWGGDRVGARASVRVRVRVRVLGFGLRFGCSVPVRVAGHAGVIVGSGVGVVGAGVLSRLAGGVVATGGRRGGRRRGRRARLLLHALHAREEPVPARAIIRARAPYLVAVLVRGEG